MLNDKTLQGKVALVTGSTSGIGKAVAQKLASYGADIIITGYTDTPEDHEVAKNIAITYGVRSSFISKNLASYSECLDLITQAEQHIGTIDILVNNAGAQHVAPAEEFSKEKWDFLISLNLSAPFYLIQKVLPSMRQKGFGRIINIASAHGLRASKQKAAYVASKHGLVGLGKVIALETAEENITCNTICPGWVLTPLVEKQIHAIAEKENISFEAASEKLLSEKQPSIEFVQPEQIGSLTGFLCTEDAAQITGSSYSIDGGWTAK